MDDDLLNYLDTLSRGDCYHVDAVLKESAQETTERVFLITANGSERGPFIRKRIALESGLGAAYERLWEAQQAGKRFMHLPRVIECCVEDGYRDVVLEYVEGETLDEAVDAPDYTERDAATIANLLCDAVQELHESFDPALIHRDLKPSNVVVSRSNITIIDFGIARTFDEEASADTKSFGTRGYAPPEQFGYGQTDERSDVYALGMLLAYCFLREEPRRALIDSGFDDPRIPVTLRPVLTKATAFDPADRYASARELKDDLRMAHFVPETLEAFDAEAAPGDACTDAPTYAPPIAPPADTSQVSGSSMSQEPHDASQVSNDGRSRTPSFPNLKANSSGTSNSTRFTDARTSSTARVSTKPNPLSRIPRWVGTTWNVLVIGVWILFSAVAVSMIFTPGTLVVEGRDVILPAKAIFIIGVFVMSAAFLLYPFLDKRGIRERLRFLPRTPWLRELILCFAIGFVILIASATIAIFIDNVFAGV